MKRKEQSIIRPPLIQNQQPKNDTVTIDNNNRTFLVGPSFSSKTYVMLKLLSRIPDRDFYIVTKSPHQRYSNSEIKIKELTEEVKSLNQYETAIIVFDDILGSTDSRYIDQFFVSCRHNNLDNFYLSQSCFD